MKHPRSSWDDYFLRIAAVVAGRSTCDRNHVGAVIVRDNIILSTGYNGSIRKMPHCAETGHEMLEGHCTSTVHAEANAILQAAYTGVSIKDGALYTTSSPCWHCFKLIANVGIKRVVYGKVYGNDLKRVQGTAKKIGISIKRHLSDR
ncbi:MAG: dCMP deaminase family protein [Fibrobacterota bacterium]